MKGYPFWSWASRRRIVLKFLIVHVICIGLINGHQLTQQQFSNAQNQKNISTPALSTNLVRSSNDGSVRAREIPEAMLDPYSVLGVLSFGVYIFYILYTRYRMKGHHNPSPQNGAQQPQGAGGTLFSADAQENIANIIKMATNIISNAPYLGAHNSTFDSDDYFDAADASELRRRFKMFKK